MAKIVEINPETISIGLDNGELKVVGAGALNFVPHIGDEVEIFESVDRIIVSKVESKTQDQPNIIINNSNSSVNTNVNKNINNAGGGKAKNKWVSFILCLLLGFIGAHKFYEGKMGMGVLYLLTMGLFGIGWLADIIIILLKPNPYYV